MYVIHGGKKSKTLSMVGLNLVHLSFLSFILCKSQQWQAFQKRFLQARHFYTILHKKKKNIGKGLYWDVLLSVWPPKGLKMKYVLFSLWVCHKALVTTRPLTDISYFKYHSTHSTNKPLRVLSREHLHFTTSGVSLWRYNESVILCISDLSK